MKSEDEIVNLLHLGTNRQSYFKALKCITETWKVKKGMYGLRGRLIDKGMADSKFSIIAIMVDCFPQVYLFSKH